MGGLARFARTILRGHKAALVGGSIAALWLAVAILAPVLVPYDPLAQDLSARLEAPSGRHLFGADDLGRDVLSRVLYGARISLPMGGFVVLLTGLIGVSIGAVSGYLGGTVDDILMRVCDAVLAFPSLILAMAITAALGPSLNNAMLAIVAVLWPEYARITRGQVLAVKELEYVTAARAMGAPARRILWRHVLPNCLAPLIVKASLDVGNAILIAAGLSFIGLGAVPPTPEWGAMVSLGRQKFYEWWVATFPGLAILSVVMGFNFLGDGLQDLLDPRLRRRP
jgi:peptide/nickel transport system permease protein